MPTKQSRPATVASESSVTSRDFAATSASAAASPLALIGLTEEAWDFFSRGIVRDFAWSALWMLYGAALMIVGFRRRAPFLRWLSLGLLAITVGKVFLYDLSALQRIYRILSFIGLGVLLLAISFAYQKKWLTVSDER